MLKLQDRTLLLDSLRPPDGYELDFAIGTTFTLDLLALLTAPLGFTLFEMGSDPEHRPEFSDPLLLLKTLRSYSDRMAIFCQAGMIALPKRAPLLFSSLEKAVIQVRAPREGGIFHPKLWILRFAAAEQPVRYRVLCLSRNLTFDCCWDTALLLDGELLDRRNAIATNHPLADFVETLPGLAVRQPVDDRVARMVAVAQDELRRVKFELPDGFDNIAFWPLGIDRHRRWPFKGRVDRMLVVAPFLSPETLDKLSEAGAGDILISRLDALRELTAEQLAGFQEIYSLNVDAAIAQEPGEESAPDPAVPSPGLHAKLYIADAGRNASLWCGSANATTAAFNANVEFAVELIGSRTKCGIARVLDGDGSGGSLRDILDPYTPAEEPELPNPSERALEKLLEQTQLLLGAIQWTTCIEQIEVKLFALKLTRSDSAKLAIDPRVAIRCWPVTLPDTSGRPLALDQPIAADFGAVSFEALTSFMAFEISAEQDGFSDCKRFVVNTTLEGAPAGRSEGILRAMLADRTQVLRFLLLLLLDGDDDLTTVLPPALSGNGAGRQATHELETLLEPLLRTLVRNPKRLDQIQALLVDMTASDDGRRLLPDGLEAVWEAVWSARPRIQQ